MIVEHPDLEGFEPLLDHVLATAHTSGIWALDQAGLKLEDIKTSPSAHRRFLADATTDLTSLSAT